MLGEHYDSLTLCQQVTGDTRASGKLLRYDRDLRLFTQDRIVIGRCTRVLIQGEILYSSDVFSWAFVICEMNLKNKCTVLVVTENFLVFYKHRGAGPCQS